jgi:hypothetical protein
VPKPFKGLRLRTVIHDATTSPTRTLAPLNTPFGIVRQPTAAECELVGRETSYSEPYGGDHNDWRELGDYVIESIHRCEADLMQELAETCESLGMCDAAHVIPAGVYLEE